jgi:ABC-2 type transport system permease protein
VICAIFIALFGLWVNLRFPNLDWITETVVVKQSAAMLITIFSGMALVGLQVLLIATVGSVIGAYAIYLFAIGILCLFIFRSLMTDGVRRFRKL